MMPTMIPLPPPGHSTCASRATPITTATKDVIGLPSFGCPEAEKRVEDLNV